MHRRLLHRAARLSMRSGGCVKIDLKAWQDSLHIALCGVSNRWTLSNFEQVAALIPDRSDPPLLVASTLLVPGYIDAEEVGRTAQFIAGLDPSIPYSLLGFFPQFFMQDLPVTSRRQALECLQAARDAGLQRVRIGNQHLLGEAT
jgi:pyruvate formate lyase activating enzyme